MTEHPTTHFLRVLDEVLQREGVKQSLVRLVHSWAGLVRECAGGYSLTIYEYWNDLSIRSDLEAVLNAPELQQFSNLRFFKERVEEIDRAFRALLVEGRPLAGPAAKFWWEESVPRIGNGEFAEDVKRNFGITLQDPDEHDKTT